MRVIFCLISAVAICILLNSGCLAQTAAVMEVKVTVINGSRLKYTPHFDFSAEPDSPGSVLEVSTAEYTAVSFSLPDTVFLTNEAGESSIVSIDCSIAGSTEHGTYTLNISGWPEQYPGTKGAFSGTLTAVISYL